MIIYSYPVKILLIDDNEEFLKVLSRNLESKKFLIETYSNSLQAEKILENNTSNSQNDFNIKDGDKLGERSINVNINGIKDIYSDNIKNNEFVVLVIDNEMPNRNGIELLKTVFMPNMYKILLTGETQEQEIIEAFNAGIIDSYISKADMDLYEKLPQQIEKGINCYFEKKSNLLKKAIVYDKTRSTALSSQVYIDYISDFIKKHKIIEYYLIDSQGSYIMFGPQKEIFTLLILGEDNGQAHLDIAIEEGCREDMLTAARLNIGKIYSFHKDANNIQFFLLDEVIPSLRGFHYKIYEGDILDFTS